MIQQSVSTPTIPLAFPRPAGQPRQNGGEKAHVVMIVPSDEGERQAEAMETWLQACTSDQPFALELASTRREQGFFLRASSQAQLEVLCKQIEAQYPQADILPVAPSDDLLALRTGEHAVIGEFALTTPAWMPIKTWSKELTEAGVDPLVGILGAMRPHRSGERVISQLALCHAPDTWISRDLRKSVEHPLAEERDAAMAAQREHTTGTPLFSDGKLLIGLSILLGGYLVYRWYQAHALLTILLLSLSLVAGGAFALWRWLHRDQRYIYDMKLVAEKLSRAAFYAQLRVIVVGKEALSSQKQLQEHLAGVEQAYRQFTLANANGFALGRMRSLTTAVDPGAQHLLEVWHAFPYRTWVLRLIFGGWTRCILNALEVGGMFHLPQEGADLPLMRRISIKPLLASPALAYHIKHTPAPLPPARIGYSYRGYSHQHKHAVPVYLPFDTLFSHKFCAAMSGYGKSTFILLLLQAALQRVRDGSLQPGIFCIDPHHDLIEDILRIIPDDRIQDVLLFDLADTAFPVGLNPLDATMGFTRDQAISNLMSCFERVWSDFWGPRMAHFLKNVCLLLYTLNEQLVRQGRADEQYTLLDINPLLQYQDYAIQVLTQLDMSETWHQELLAWWQNTYFTLPRQSSFRQEVIMPVITKMSVFNDNMQLRRIAGQSITTVKVHEAITRGNIVLCALASRDIDDAAVNILGSTLINLLHRAFGAQHAVPTAQRRRVFVAIDEFQAFPGSDFDKLLSEDRKFGCAMLLATQSLKRLNKVRDGLLEMVLSNCENLFAFTMSAADAAMLEEELHGKVSQKHIISQPRLHCYARLAVPGFSTQIASVALDRPASWQYSPEQEQRATAIRRRNQLKNLPAAEVERRHAEHLSQFLDVGPYARHIEREAYKVQTRARRQRQGETVLQPATEVLVDRTTGVAQAATPPLNQQSRLPSPLHAGKRSAPLPGSHGDSARTRAVPQTPAGSSASKQESLGNVAKEQNKQMKGHTRNHRRSRRKGKQPVGTPPPLPSEHAATAATHDPEEPDRPLLFPSGMRRSISRGYERERT